MDTIDKEIKENEGVLEWEWIHREDRVICRKEVKTMIFRSSAAGYFAYSALALTNRFSSAFIFAQ